MDNFICVQGTLSTVNFQSPTCPYQLPSPSNSLSCMHGFFVVVTRFVLL